MSRRGASPSEHHSDDARGALRARSEALPPARTPLRPPALRTAYPDLEAASRPPADTLSPQHIKQCFYLLNLIVLHNLSLSTWFEYNFLIHHL